MKNLAIKLMGSAAVAAGFYFFVLGEPDTYQALCNIGVCALIEVGVLERNFN